MNYVGRTCEHDRCMTGGTKSKRSGGQRVVCEGEPAPRQREEGQTSSTTATSLSTSSPSLRAMCGCLALM